MQEKWYQKTWFVVLMFILLWPVGLVLMWTNKKWTKTIRIIITVVVLGLACVAYPTMYHNNKVNQTSPEEAVKPTVDKSIHYEVDWKTCQETTEADIRKQAKYDFIREPYFDVDEENRVITLFCSVSDSTSKDKALDLADYMVRQFDVNAHAQDDNIALPEGNSYGGLYDAYILQVGIAPSSTRTDESTWLVENYFKQKENHDTGKVLSVNQN